MKLSVGALVAVVGLLGLACGDSTSDNGGGGSTSSKNGGEGQGNSSQGGQAHGGAPNGGNSPNGGNGGDISNGGNGGDISNGGNGGDISNGGNGGDISNGGNGGNANGGGGQGQGGGNAQFAACDDIGACSGTGAPDSGCIECSVIGDSTVAPDGGTCYAPYVACYSTDFQSCGAAGGGDPDCCALDACYTACDAAGNNNGTTGDTQAEFDCACTNDGTQCLAQQQAGTCQGNHVAGRTKEAAIIDCFYNQVCPSSCGGTALPACDDIGVCAGDGQDPASGCLECSIIGDTSTTTDGGSCQDEYGACYGFVDANCTGGNVQCCQLDDCIAACDTNGNNNGTAGDTPAEFNCICANNGTQCNANQPAGSCFGNFPQGLALEQTLGTCVYTDVCPVSCN